MAFQQAFICMTVRLRRDFAGAQKNSCWQKWCRGYLTSMSEKSIIRIFPSKQWDIIYSPEAGPGTMMVSPPTSSAILIRAVFFSTLSGLTDIASGKPLLPLLRDPIYGKLLQKINLLLPTI